MTANLSSQPCSTGHASLFVTIWSKDFSSRKRIHRKSTHNFAILDTSCQFLKEHSYSIMIYIISRQRQTFTWLDEMMIHYLSLQPLSTPQHPLHHAWLFTVIPIYKSDGIPNQKRTTSFAQWKRWLTTKKWPGSGIRMQQAYLGVHWCICKSELIRCWVVPQLERLRTWEWWRIAPMYRRMEVSVTLDFKLSTTGTWLLQSMNERSMYR